MQALDEPIIGIILADTQYHRYLNTWWILANVQTANQKARSVFRSDDTPRKVWNALMLQRPHFCGHIHESDWSEITVGECPYQDNPICGHPEETRFFHGIWIGAYIAQHFDPSIPHPKTVLNHGVINLDRVAQMHYWTNTDALGWWSPIPKRLIPSVKREIQAKEKDLWKEVVEPYMMKVSKVLQKIAA